MSKRKKVDTWIDKKAVEMTWEDAIAWLAQGLINIAEGIQAPIEEGSPIHVAMLCVVMFDLAVKEGRAGLPQSWRPNAAHLAGYMAEKKVRAESDKAKG